MRQEGNLGNEIETAFRAGQLDHKITKHGL